MSKCKGDIYKQPPKKKKKKKKNHLSLSTFQNGRT